MTPSDDVLAVQGSYPQIWFACHVAHQTRQNGALTDRDAGILAHLSEPGLSSAAALARHLGIGKPALSAHIARLSEMGLITTTTHVSDRRKRLLQLTADGRNQLSESSSLDAHRVATMLAQLSDAERRRAIDGIRLLAQAARRMRDATDRVTSDDAGAE